MGLKAGPGIAPGPVVREVNRSTRHTCFGVWQTAAGPSTVRDGERDVYMVHGYSVGPTGEGRSGRVQVTVGALRAGDAGRR